MANLVTLCADDAADLQDLQKAAYANETDSERKNLPDLNQSLDSLEAELDDPDMLCYGVRDEQGDLVAAIRSFVGPEIATVGRLCVHPESQGQGLATYLLNEMEKQVPEGVRAMQVFTGEDEVRSHRLYAKLGYVDVKHEEMDAGFTIVQLKKTLA